VRTDVFAAAVLAFHALSGRLPFSAPDVASLRAAHAHEPPQIELLRGDVPRALSTLLAACLSLRPEQRPSDVEELRGQLQKFAHEAVGEPLDETPRPLPMSATQAQARGQLVVTPKDAASSDAETSVLPAAKPETESVSQPISVHGEHRVRAHWHLLAAAGLGISAFFAAAAMLPRPRSPRWPPALPAVPAPVRVAPAPPAESEPELTKPDAAKPVKRRYRAPRREAAPAFRTGRPLSRDDF
jgi:serine/threonine protein kinase